MRHKRRRHSYQFHLKWVQLQTPSIPSIPFRCRPPTRICSLCNGQNGNGKSQTNCQPLPARRVIFTFPAFPGALFASQICTNCCTTITSSCKNQQSCLSICNRWFGKGNWDINKCGSPWLSLTWLKRGVGQRGCVAMQKSSCNCMRLSCAYDTLSAVQGSL